MLYAIDQCYKRHIDKDTLNNGISYFLGPLLNWTLAGIVRVLLTEIAQRRSVPRKNGCNIKPNSPRTGSTRLCI